MDAHAERMQAAAQRKKQAVRNRWLKLLGLAVVVIVLAYGYRDHFMPADGAPAEARSPIGPELITKEDVELAAYRERVKDWNRLTPEEKRGAAMGDKEVERCLDAALAGAKPVDVPANQPNMVSQTADLCRAGLSKR